MMYESINAYDEGWFDDNGVDPLNVSIFLHSETDYRLVELHGEEYDWELLKREND